VSSVSDPTDYKGASAEAIQHHYDLGNDFYELWLDESRTYSCALWESDDEPLETAQMRKLDHIAGNARIEGAARVLDVGCGWGSMMRRLVDEHGVQHVTGLTLSEAQAEHVSNLGDERFEVRVENWADHEPETPYDGIVSIGAFEHFADYGMPRAERIAQYKRWFERTAGWLPKGGRLSLQTISKGGNVRADREMRRDLLFVIEKIFPESELPWLSEIAEACERRFEIVGLRNDPEHYARTCQAWLDGLLAKREQAEQMVGADAVADYERYLRASVRAFSGLHLGLLRIAFQRV
jgi:cyclopropane-fatty-acyl-phospholipid synthase